MKLAACLIAVAVLAVGGWTAARWHRSPGPVTAPAAPPPGRAVASVALDGPSLPIVTLRDALATRVGAPVDDAVLAADRVRVTDILIERGYLGATVAPAAVSWGASGAHVTFDVAPGGIFRVRNVRIEGADLFDGLDAIPTAKAGENVSLNRARHGVALIDRWLANHGARDALVAYRLDLDPQALEADIVYVVSRPRLARR